MRQMENTISGRSWSLAVKTEQIDVTSSSATWNERWTYTDDQGHEHRYESGFPTLDLVVDAEHWCDGTEGWMPHDPHREVDESHYECKVCREVITPATDPPFTPKYIPGSTSCELTGFRSDGAKVTVWLTEDDYRALMDGMDPNDSDDQDTRVTAMLDALPDERILSATITG